MAKKSGIKSEEIQKAINRIKNAEKKRDDADKKYGYSRCLDEYNGNYADSIPSFVAGVDLIPINEVYAYAKTFVPSVYSRDPYICINPKGKQFIIGAKILEYAVNAYWRELQLKRQIKKSVFDAIFAEGFIKLGYSSSLGSIKKEDGEKSIAPSEFIENDEIFAVRVSWKNIVRDPDATDDLYDARFVAHQIILPTDAIKASSMYENTEDLNPNFQVKSINNTTKSAYGQNYEILEKYSVLYEVWDRDMEMVYTISEGCDKYLMNKKWPYKFSGSKHSYPFEMIRFNEAPDACYAPNMIAPWEPQLWEKMKIRAIELDHIKRFGRQLIAEKGALSRQEMDKFKKGITGSIIQKEQGKPDPMPIAYPPIQTDIYAIENRIDLDKDSISGQPNVVRSAPQKTSSRTLGEVDRLISAFQSRQNDPQGVVEDFSERVSKKLIGLMQQYFNKNKYIRVANIDMAWMQRELKDNPPQPEAMGDIRERMDPMGFLMKPEDIKKIEFEVEVRAGSTLPLDRKNRVSSMVNIVELGEKIGIMQGDKVSKVIGKNLVAEFDMPEITAAYEDSLRRMDANEKVNLVGGIAKAELAKQQADRLGKMHAASTGKASGQGAPSAPVVPPELIS